MPKTFSNAKVTVSIIGAGRLGTALAIALSRSGYKLQSLIGRSLAKLKRSASLLDVPVQLLAAKDIDKLPAAAVLIIATPDDQIPLVVEQLSTLQFQQRRTPTVLHTSGALSSEILEKLAMRNWATGSMHPLVSVSDPITGASQLRGAYWCIEGQRKAERMSRRLIRDLEGHSFSINPSTKPLYHAAAVMTSGNVVALFDVAVDMLSRCGLARSQARRVLLPLLRSTLRNLGERSTAKALTGTFSRGDVVTVERHLAALEAARVPHANVLYRVLGHKALELAEENGLDPAVRRRITKKLDQ